MILKISWNNIWRNKLRSVVVISAIAIGLWAGIFASAFVKGLMTQKVESVIAMEMSHFQFHHPKFRDEMYPNQYVENGTSIEKKLRDDANVIGVSSRLISNAMLGSANQNGSIKVNGISPEDESIVTKLDQRLVEGAYFQGIKRNPILISKKIAEKYKLKLKSKLVLTFQDVNNDITSASFRVVGIIDSKNGVIDELNVYVRRSDLAPLLQIENGYHEIAVFLEDNDLAEPIAQKYKDKYPQWEVLPWLDLSTGMRYMVEAMGMYTYILVGIILLALLFSIINTMLMAVLERTREVGMLMAIGMKKGQVFSMILIETIFLSMIGGPLGILLSALSISYFGHTGIYLGQSGYEDFGFSNTVYPYLDMASYINVTIMVIVMAILAAIYPAKKALSLNPVEAIRKI